MVHSVVPLQRGDGAVVQLSEFAKEGERPTTTPPTAVFNGPMFGGPTLDTMWLRLSIGLVSMNRSGAVARFDYVRTYGD
jgi:arabinan endo-1,5-alpha-L-arabinosidase